MDNQNIACLLISVLKVQYQIQQVSFWDKERLKNGGDRNQTSEGFNAFKGASRNAFTYSQNAASCPRHCFSSVNKESVTGEIAAKLLPFCTKTFYSALSNSVTK